MPSFANLRHFIDEFRDLVDQKDWSGAVIASREAEARGRINDNYLEILLRLSSEKKATKLEFSLNSENYTSDCRCDDDPCIHLLAGAIIGNSKKDEILNASSSDTESSNSSFLSYHVSIKDDELYLKRFLHIGETIREFKDSLVEYVGGVSSGRIKEPVPMVTAEEYIVDQGFGLVKNGSIKEEYFNKTIKALSSLHEVYYNDNKLNISEDEEETVVAAVIKDDVLFFSEMNNSSQKLNVENNILRWKRIIPEEIKQYLNTSFPIEEIPLVQKNILPLFVKNSVKLIPPKEGWPEVQKVKPEIRYQVDKIEEGYAVTPVIEYGKPTVAIIKKGKMQRLSNHIIPERNIELENRISREAYQKTSLKVGRQRILNDDQAVLFAENVDDKQIKGDSLRALRSVPSLQPVIDFKDKSLDFYFTLDSSDSKEPVYLSLDEVRRWYDTGSGTMSLSDGTLAKIPADLMKDLSPILSANSLNISGSGKKQSGTLQALVISGFLENNNKEAVKSFFDKIQDSKNDKTEIRCPEDITLRSYQIEGIKWLKGLSEIDGAGALLADDMGLGKTLQTLLSLDFPCLIVVPTSLLPQWEDEIRRFCPDKHLCIYHGQSREWSSDSDIFLTTYGILRNESDFLGSKSFNLIVLDEIQTIKNPESAVSQAAFGLQASFKVGLTGTPVENSVIDLWSIFNFIIPGLLPSPDLIWKSLETEGGLQTIKRIIHPFIKRRTKELVLDELPKKTEITIPCNMDTAQRSLYDAVYNEARLEASRYLKEKKNIISLFEKLLRLRQICVCPVLAGIDETASTKLEVVLELLKNSTDAGHRVLLFSQWTSALDLVTPMIESQVGKTLRIDGSTVNRADVIKSFKTDENYKVFLLSLKAGGVGLNLTEADHVFFLDSWWNPAVESQAADRVHRIGQDKPVFIYRVVVKNSIEEKIIELQKKKSNLSKALLDDSPGVNTKITDDDLAFLFSL